jgi:hypothetical protein
MRLGRIMYAANFFVALSDQHGPANKVRFVYFVDEVDDPPAATSCSSWWPANRRPPP